MADFYLDFRPPSLRQVETAAEAMRYFPDLKVEHVSEKEYSLLIVRPRGEECWGSYFVPDKSLLVAVSGRVFFDQSEWAAANDVQGVGGAACKVIAETYKKYGVAGLARMSGSFVMIIHDRVKKAIFLITDRCGMHPCFSVEAGGYLVLCSHPDVLAEATDAKGQIDLVSICEFLVTGKVSAPNSYYEGIKTLENGCAHTIALSAAAARGSIVSRKLSSLEFDVEHGRSEWDLAEELKGAFRRSMSRRVLPMFGQAAISLSGGLDSRALLCSVSDPSRLWTFCFFDEENREFEIARKIAEGVGVRFLPLKRRFEHYGENAVMGVRISGGMGDFGSNHFLGFRESLGSLGVDNVIAGFYCDYFFKGLLLDKTENPWLKRQSLSEYREEAYMPHFWFDTEHSRGVRSRLNANVTEDMKRDRSPTGRLHIERRRLFPLCYEPDNQETLVPQRVLGWSLPILDNDVVDTYLRIPPAYKMNVSFYSKMVSLVCGKKISSITNINTGAGVGASPGSILLHKYLVALQRRVRSWHPTMGSDESWPNWVYYVAHSKVIEQLWARENSGAADLFREVLGFNPLDRRVGEFKGRELKLFLRLLTIKIWKDIYDGVSGPSRAATSRQGK